MSRLECREQGQGMRRSDPLDLETALRISSLPSAET